MDFVIPKLFTDKDYAKKIFTKAGGHGALSVAVGMVNEYAPDFKFTGDVESDWDRLFGEGVNGDVIEDAYGIGLAPLVQAVNEPAKVEDGGLKVGGEETYKLDPTSLALGLAQSRTGTLGSVSVQQTKDIAQACTKSETQAIRDFGQSVLDGLDLHASRHTDTIETAMHEIGDTMKNVANRFVDIKESKKKTDVVVADKWSDFKAGDTAMFVFNDDLIKYGGIGGCKENARYLTLGDQGGNTITATHKMFAGMSPSGNKEYGMNLSQFLIKWFNGRKNELAKLPSQKQDEINKLFSGIIEKLSHPTPAFGLYDPVTGKMMKRSKFLWKVTFENDEYDLVIRALTDRGTTPFLNMKTVVSASSGEKEGARGGELNTMDAQMSRGAEQLSREYEEDDTPYGEEEEEGEAEPEYAEVAGGGKGTDPFSILVKQSGTKVMNALRNLYATVKASPAFPSSVKNADVFTDKDNIEIFESPRNSVVRMSNEALCSLVARTLAALIGSANRAGISLFDADRLSFSEKDGVLVIDDYGFNEIGRKYYDAYVSDVRKPIEAKNYVFADFKDDAVAKALALMYSTDWLTRREYGDELRPNPSVSAAVGVLTDFENKLRPIVAEFTDIFDTGADRGKFDLGKYVSETDPEMTASEFIKTVDDTVPSELPEEYVDMLHGIVNKVVGNSKEAMAKFAYENYGFLKSEFDKYPTLSETMKEIDEIPKPVDRAGAMALLIVDGYEHPDYFGVNAGELYSAVFKVLSDRSMIDTGADDDKKRLTVSEITDWDALDPKVDIAQLIADIAEMDPEDMNEQYVNLLRGLVNAIVGEQLGKFVQQNAKKLATEFPSLNRAINDIYKFPPQARTDMIEQLISDVDKGEDEDVTPSELYTAVFRVIAGLTSEDKKAADEEYDPAYAVKQVIRPESSTVESIASLKEIAKSKSIKLGEMLEKALSSMVGVDSISDMIEEIKSSKDAEGLNNLIRTVTSKLGQQFARVRGESGAGTSAEMVGLIDFGVEPDKTVGAESLDKAKDDIEVIAPSVNQLLGLSVADLFGNGGNAHPVVPKSQKNPYKKLKPKK